MATGADTGALLSGIGSILGPAADFMDSLFGDTTRGTTSTNSNTSGTQTERLKLSEDALNAIIRDVLGGADGLASLFSGEKVAGIFNSSVAAQAAGDLASKLVGELAKLTAERETTAKTETAQSTGTTQKNQGILENIVGGVGSIGKDIGKLFGL